MGRVMTAAVAGTALIVSLLLATALAAGAAERPPFLLQPVALGTDGIYTGAGDGPFSDAHPKGVARRERPWNSGHHPGGQPTPSIRPRSWLTSIRARWGRRRR